MERRQLRARNLRAVNLSAISRQFPQFLRREVFGASFWARRRTATLPLSIADAGACLAINHDACRGTIYYRINRRREILQTRYVSGYSFQWKETTLLNNQGNCAGERFRT